MSGSSGEGAAIRAVLEAAGWLLWLFWKILTILFRCILLLFFFWQSRKPKWAQILSFPLQSRFEHTLIVGGSGHGKTQLLQAEFVSLDLARVAMGSETVIFIDSQGDMLKRFYILRN
jgi:Type IV secretion-system coupling protein DNA-binding domain